MENDKVRVRFAPSPTGMVHIGSLRTALFCYLFARHHGGVNVLRIEDTDQTRKVDGAIENLLVAMSKVGIQFDEGLYLTENNKLSQRGEFGPYVQSERLDIYKKHVEELLNAKQAYYCFCTEQRLQELRTEQVALKKPPMYDRACRNLSAEQLETKQAEFLASGQKPVVRQALPLDGKTEINDLVYGKIVYDNELLDDQVLIKSDGFPTYHFAVVVDDHFMQITHVIRGEEWIPSTPKHLLLYKAFGWEAPHFAHLPLILNPDKTKLSKRQGDVAVEDYLKKGYLPETLVNFVALLGWNPKTEQEIFSMQELIAQFGLEKLNKSGAVFDVQKLNWMSAQYIKQLSVKDLVEKCSTYWQLVGIDTSTYKSEFLEKVVAMEKERLHFLSEIVERTQYCFKTPEYDKELLMWRKSNLADAKIKLTELKELFNSFNGDEFEMEKLEEKLKNFITEKSYDNGSVLWPLRVSMTGLDKSPGPFEVISTLASGWGKNEILTRIQAAIDKI